MRVPESRALAATSAQTKDKSAHRALSRKRQGPTRIWQAPEAPSQQENPRKPARDPPQDGKSTHTHISVANLAQAFWFKPFPSSA